jgi:hypothetical protein
VSSAVVDLVVLPLGCIACGLLAAAAFVSRHVPGAGALVNAMLPYRRIIGVATAVSGVLALLVPASGPPVFGSLFPAASGILVGGMFSVELLAGGHWSRRGRELVALIGNALLYVKGPLGLCSIFFGFSHLLFHGTLFF